MSCQSATVRIGTSFRLGHRCGGARRDVGWRSERRGCGETSRGGRVEVPGWCLVAWTPALLLVDAAFFFIHIVFQSTAYPRSASARRMRLAWVCCQPGDGTGARQDVGLRGGAMNERHWARQSTLLALASVAATEWLENPKWTCSMATSTCVWMASTPTATRVCLNWPDWGPRYTACVGAPA